MPKFKVNQSLESKDFWSLCIGDDLTTEKLYPTRAEAVQAGIDQQFLDDHFEIIDLTKETK
jgi:hypothetical protein